MYGTVARMRAKEGQARAIGQLMDEWNRERGPKVKGSVAGYLYQTDADPNELILVAVFQDRETYEANADDPEQDRWFQRIHALLEADPEWSDGEIIAT